ncbi:MAG: 50S ribosomal protein L30 [Cetobacterium sp.]|uniref:Large ribosomal subunit protein uL30 n=1 Tax=Cetobacterium ceti TaxID=180163 RepID=A0A1T4Q3V4_9FUSO|nr:50S ribosomal protein L30 [Cetobacterium ceti]MCJ8341772.1 50S ribosomal protein L30 [Cetobacterium sp.]SJZ98429.1 LSU ribosomal protein L30P [Cetobacterium ceti]
MAKLRIELIKSIIGRKPNHIATLKSLGLKKINDVAEHTATPEIKGKLAQVSYLIKVEEVQ